MGTFAAGQSPSRLPSIPAHAPRSILFVPGDQIEDLLSKAIASGADAVAIDLEDAVPPAAKAAARASLARIPRIEARPVPVYVRVNGPRSGAFDSDLAAAAACEADAVIIPKCEAVDDLRAVTLRRTASGTPMLAIVLVESPAGVLRAAELADVPGVIGLALGGEDLALALGALRTRGGRELLLARSMLVLAAAASGRWAVDTPTLDLRDAGFIERESRAMRRLGFTGKLAIHPAQVAPIHRGFRPTREEAERARAIVAAANGSSAAVGSIRGAMVDGPVLTAARRLLERAAWDKGGANEEPKLQEGLDQHGR